MSSKMDGICCENNVSISLKPNHDIPGKCGVFFNPKMRVNREMCLVALNVSSKSLLMNSKPLCCLDAFSASGISGLQWKKYLQSDVQVTLNDISSENYSEIVQNVDRNGFVSVRDLSTSSETDVEVTCQDANVVLHQRQFHFIHLDPFGCVANYVDAAFRNVYSGGVIVATATDISSLYGVCPAPTLRNYGASVVRTVYMREIAARIVISALARSAAKCSKGVRVLYCAAAEHFVQVAVSVQRGAQHADKCIRRIHDLYICSHCQSFGVNSEDIGRLVESPYSLLTCNCYSEDRRHTAAVVGPMWCGDIFDVDFIGRMVDCVRSLELSEQTQLLIAKLHGEALVQLNDALMEHTVSDSADSVRVPPSKRTKVDPTSTFTNDNAARKASSQETVVPHRPLFYYCLHKRHLKNVNLPRVVCLVKLLKSEGFLAAETHFEPRGAVRTNAPFHRIDELLRERFHQKL